LTCDEKAFLRFQYAGNAKAFTKNTPTCFQNSQSKNVGVKFMPEEKKKGKAEQTAEKTGEVVGKGLKKGFGVAKGIGAGLKKGVKGEDEKEKKK
jgi:hypothetical protein